MDGRKRRRSDGAPYGNGGFKRTRQETDSTGIGTKSKPCTKFFSTSGCPFGDNCHFLHHVTGGYNAVAQMMNLSPPVPPFQRNTAPPPPPMLNSSPDAKVKTRMCNKYNTAEGCRYGEKCHFAHGEWELGKSAAPSYDDPRHAVGPPRHFPGWHEPANPGFAGSFGTSASAKISVDASLAGVIIGKGGVTSKQICRQTGAKLSIRDHETDPNSRNIELEGSFEQIEEASAMVRELLATLVSTGAHTRGHGGSDYHSGGGGGGGGGGEGREGHRSGSHFKTKLCENFPNGLCTFGDRCNFAHGASELRQAF